MNTCASCKWWEKIPDATARDCGNPDAVNESFGVCENPKLQVNSGVLLDNAYIWIQYGDGGKTARLETGKNFGCVHHE